MSNAVKPKPVAIARHIERINNCGALNIATKQVLINALRSTPKIFMQEAASAANDTTTVAASTYLTCPLEAAHRYLVTVKAKLTNANAADGVKVTLTLSGTQTTAVYNVTGSCNDLTNVTYAAMSSASLALQDADSGTVYVDIQGTIVPQNDGTLVFNHAEVANAVGAGGSILTQYSYMTVREVE